MADRVLIFASDPGRVRTQLPVLAAAPARCRQRRGARADRRGLRADDRRRRARRAAPTEEPARSASGDRLPDADIARMEGLLELLVDDAVRRPRRPAQAGRGDRAHRRRAAAAGRRRCRCSGFAQLADGDLHAHAARPRLRRRRRTRSARRCSAASCSRTCRWSRTSATASSRSRPASCRSSRSCGCCEDSLDATEAERVLKHGHRVGSPRRGLRVRLPHRADPPARAGRRGRRDDCASLSRFGVMRRPGGPCWPRPLLNAGLAALRPAARQRHAPGSSFHRSLRQRPAPHDASCRWISILQAPVRRAVAGAR